MTGLQKPPSEVKPSRGLTRFLLVLILASIVSLLVYVVTLTQQATTTETIRMIDVERPSAVDVDGVTINLVDHDSGPVTVVLIHDDEITGMMTLKDVAEGLPEGFRATRIDLPGFGLSDRLPFESQLHTVGGAAEAVATVIDQRFSIPVVVAGVGHGGEVAAEIAFTHPELVRGLVMIDTDFDAKLTLEQSLQSFPFVSTAATYFWETGGPFAIQEWAPFCESGGWCPSEADLAARSQIVRIQGTTDSFEQYRRTPPSALAGSNLDELDVPTAYVWSSSGPVGKEIVDRTTVLIPNLVVVESATSAAHLLDVAAVTSAIEAVGS